MNLQEYRHKQLAGLTNEIGVYALCDLDKIPLYVGLSNDGIRKRVRRHLTSARSDVIANRQLDVWEIGFVWAWPTSNASLRRMKELESYIGYEFHQRKPLMNGTIFERPVRTLRLPKMQEVVILPLEEIEKRKDPLLRLPRQAAQFNNLFSHILEVNDTHFLRRDYQ